MTQISGGAVALTGAASGIGRALALAFAEKGADLALADVDAGALADVAEQIRTRHNVAVSVHVTDVADAAAVQAFRDAAIARHPKLHILVCNAGIALQGRFDEMDLADLEKIMAVNFWGVVNGCHAFLPHLKAQPSAHIITLSSIFGIIAPPGQTAYSASKFAVRGFTEALRHELEDSAVRVAAVHPGGIKTPIAARARLAAKADPKTYADRAARFAELARTSPEAAAKRIIEGIERDEGRILIGPDARLMDRLQRWLPVRYWRLIRRQVEKRMQAPVRRGPGDAEV